MNGLDLIMDTCSFTTRTFLVNPVGAAKDQIVVRNRSATRPIRDLKKEYVEEI